MTLNVGTNKVIIPLFKEKVVISSINPVYSATYDNNDSADEVEISTTGNDKGEIVVEKKGEMDMFYRNSDAAIEKRTKEKLRQTNIKEACDQNLKASVVNILLDLGTK